MEKKELNDNNNDNGFNYEKTDEMLKYEKETGKYAIWRGQITEGYKKWLKGAKIYFRDKERISLYVSEETKNEWLDYLNKNSKYTTISKLIRVSVDQFIKGKESSKSAADLPKLSHALKEPLTTIKGFSQLLLENYKDELSETVLITIENIFEQSKLLEQTISSIIEEIKKETPQYEILLIEDDHPTIRLITSYFEVKGHTCKGIMTGKKAWEELENSIPPKFILLDILLPDISGYDLCKKIKSDERFSKIPVYFLTAIPGSEVDKKLAETKADGYILKPFDLSEFDEKIFDKL
jgi:CheY-like chemotaxis protein